jgi:hypothetical protein
MEKAVRFQSIPTQYVSYSFTEKYEALSSFKRSAETKGLEIAI